jgi:protein gp37
VTTKIEWVKNSDGSQGKTWNPIVGCSPASEGCRNCYAKALHDKRHKAWLDGWTAAPAQYHKPFSEVQLLPERLEEPLHWRKPQTVFVCSVSDLFHEDVPDEYIGYVFAVMVLCPQHTFQVLTKRPERMRQYMADNNYIKVNDVRVGQFPPLPNVWLGVTSENQEQADKRIPLLLQTPAAVRFVSVEPMLGPVWLSGSYHDWLEGWEIVPEHDSQCPGGGPYCETHCPVPFQEQTAKLDWVICGGETGPNRRHTDIDWIRNLRDQCVAAGVPFFLKQMEVDGRIVKMPELDNAVWKQMPGGAK